MKNIILRLGAVLLALVVCLTVFAACGSDDKAKGDVKGTETSQVTEETEKTSTGDGTTTTGTIKIEDLYGDMTEEEIAQFHQDLEDLGMTVDEFLGLLYE